MAAWHETRGEGWPLLSSEPQHATLVGASSASCALQVTLVDRTARFVFKPLLYELINGAAQTDEVAPRFDQLLAPYTTRFVQVYMFNSVMLSEHD